MRIAFPIIILLVVLLGKGNNGIDYRNAKSSFNETLDKSPEFFVLEWKEGTKLFPKKTDFFIEIDSLGAQEVAALVNEQAEPVLYAADISTPVCADGECKLMNIKFYWTLLGEYAGFDKYAALPLTKHDHDEFQLSDYQKLHKLLSDDKSLLGRRSIHQLVEKPTMRKVNGVDAVSGATIARVKKAVVSGALYSCYTAWHLVHGDIREQLKTYSLSVLNENTVIEMLYSINDDYQLYALEKIDIPEYKEHYLQIAKVFKTSTPLVRSIIAKRLTSKYKDAPNLQKPFWEAFDSVDSGSRSLLVANLDKAPDYVPSVLSTKLSSMSKNQLRRFLDFLSGKETLNTETRNNLLEFANSKTEIYAYFAEEFLTEGQ